MRQTPTVYIDKRPRKRFACTLYRTERGRDSEGGQWLSNSHGWLREIVDGEVVLQAIVTNPPQQERDRWELMEEEVLVEDTEVVPMIA